MKLRPDGQEKLPESVLRAGPKAPHSTVQGGDQSCQFSPRFFVQFGDGAAGRRVTVERGQPRPLGRGHSRGGGLLYDRLPLLLIESDVQAGGRAALLVGQLPASKTRHEMLLLVIRGKRTK